MKNVSYLLLIPLLFSCGKESSENAQSRNILENLTFTVDTVVVDSGVDIFILSSGLGTKSLNQDKSKLLFFEKSPLNLVQVDLNKLKLVSKTSFQKEGPNGVGSNWLRFQLGSDGDLFINGYTTQGIFDARGRLLKSLNVVPEGIEPDLANNVQQLYENAVYDFENNRIYSQPPSQGNEKHLLFIIDPITKELQIEPIPEMKAVMEFTGTLVVDGMINFFAVDNQMYIENQQLLLTVGAMSAVYRLDLMKNSFEFINIQHKNFPNRMTFSVNNSTVEQAEFNKDRKKVFEHLNYMEPRWDESRVMFLRLGKKTFVGKKREDPSTYEVFLFAYDQDFNVLGETKIEGLKQAPGSYFWKDGKLWSYVNVEDELGFAVIDFKF
ncbi:DUF4221 family protein [uncultured Cyclobacterium sp.]|uniref:DUF4221 family protein n=1 Tax=uncultured Cyclobacterium sp. TaxID=453820 RepID=UPI0030EDD846|tara:strand:- start:27174 stop:28313 length:1140 start_codon:yes stop_codon:yes gene_type:complete